MTKRYNAFNQIHKGLRTMLYHAAMELQHNDFTDGPETKCVFKKVEEVLSFCHDHGMHENKYILPAVRRYNPGIVKEFETEHESAESLAHRLKSLLIVYTHAVSDVARSEAGEAIYKAFNEFIAFNLYHMNKEEEKLNKLLWLHYTDAEILGINEAIVASIPWEKFTIQGAWIMRGINNEEIVMWLCAVKNGAPDHVFQALLGLAEMELPANRWTKVREELCDGTMVS